MDFIGALRSVQIRSLVNIDDLQLCIHDEVNLAGITLALVPRPGQLDGVIAATRPSRPS